MVCQSCEERRKMVRDAWINGQIAEAVRQAAIGAAELSGLKEKSIGVERRQSIGLGEESGAPSARDQADGGAGIAQGNEQDGQ